MDLFLTKPRFRIRARELSALVVAISLANAIGYVAIRYGSTGQSVVPPTHHRPIEVESNTPDAHRLRETMIFLTTNVVAVALWGYVLSARHLERVRRFRLCLPEGYDERREEDILDVDRTSHIPGLHASPGRGGHARWTP